MKRKHLKHFLQKQRGVLPSDGCHSNTQKSLSVPLRQSGILHVLSRLVVWGEVRGQRSEVKTTLGKPTEAYVYLRSVSSAPSVPQPVLQPCQSRRGHSCLSLPLASGGGDQAVGRQGSHTHTERWQVTQRDGMQRWGQLGGAMHGGGGHTFLSTSVGSVSLTSSISWSNWPSRAPRAVERIA